MKRDRRVLIFIYAMILVIVNSFSPVVAENEESTFQFRVKRVDNKGNPIEGAILEISDNVNMPNSSDYVTDELGMVYGTSYNKIIYIRDKYLPNGEALSNIKRQVDLSILSDININTLNLEEGLVGFRIKLKVNGKNINRFKVFIKDESNNILDELYTSNGEIKTREYDRGIYTIEYIFNDGIKEYRATKEVKINKKGFFSEGLLEVDFDLEIEKKSFRIIKTDENKRKLKNIIFNLYTEDGVFVEELITNAKGEVESSKLPFGKYIIQEVENDKFISLGEIKYELSRESVEIINIVNRYAIGELNVLKLDIDTKRPIKGVEFGIYRHSDNVLLEIIKTNNKGEAVSKQLDFGDYYIKEYKSAKDYKKDETIITFTISESERVVEKIVYNQREYVGDIKINKKDEKGKALSGVYFNIYDGNGVFLETIYTNRIGEAKSSKLPYGKYILEEVRMEGFIPIENIEINIDSEETQEINIVNEYSFGNITIKKVDYETKRPLYNVKFKVYRKEDDSFVYSLTTNTKGNAVGEKLDFGDYYFKEVETRNGYELSDEKYEFTVDRTNKEVVKTVENKKIEPPVDKEEKPKPDPDPKPDPEDKETTKEKVLRLVKKDFETKEVLDGVEFNLYTSKGDLVETMVTDKNGLALSKKPLKNVSYTIKEVKSPKGYFPIKDIKVRLDLDNVSEEKDGKLFYEIEIENKKTLYEISKVDNRYRPLSGAKLRLSEKDSKKIIKDWISDGKAHELRGLEVGVSYILEELEPVDGYLKAKDQEILIKTEKDKGLDLVNEPIKTRIIKLDEKTDKPLKNVVFNLEDNQGEPLKFNLEEGVYSRDDEGEEKLVTDSKGEIVLETLETGKFYLVEKSPNQYYDNIGRVEIIVAEDNMVNPVIIRNDRINKFGRLNLIKRDSFTDEAIEAVEIRILDEEKNEVGIYETNKDGEIIEDLPFGKYYYQEIKSDRRYQLDKKEHEISIDKEDVIEDFYNEANQLKIIKTDGKEKRLEGVKFKILDMDDKVLSFNYDEEKEVYINDDHGKVEDLETNDKGEIFILRMARGNYKIEEEESIPGYVIDKAPKEIELVDVLEITITNKNMSEIVDVPAKKKEEEVEEEKEDKPQSDGGQPSPGSAGPQGPQGPSGPAPPGPMLSSNTTPKTGDSLLINNIMALLIAVSILFGIKKTNK